VQGELNGGTSAGSILQSTFGDRKEMVVHTVPQSDSIARATAETLFKRLARQFVTGQGIVDPDPRLKVGVSVNFQGLGPLFSGRYYVSGLRHLFDRQSGLRTELMVERPGLGS
jgi:phage protein D